jgi:hypothetical protein
MRRVLLALSLITLSATAALTVEDPGWRNSDLGWREYRNQRFGITLVYPSRVFRFERASTAGDGELFVSRDGRAQLLIGALENQEHYSTASYQRFISKVYRLPILSGPEGRLRSGRGNVDRPVGHYGRDDGLREGDV